MPYRSGTARPRRRFYPGPLIFFVAPLSFLWWWTGSLLACVAALAVAFVGAILFDGVRGHSR